jgi:protein phosphatase
MDRNEFDTGEYDLAELQQQAAAHADSSGPRVQSVIVTVGASSHQGLVRPNNEDHFLVGRLCRQAEVLLTNLPEGYVPRRFEQTAHAMAVADGMGGAAAGEVASALALSLGMSMTLDASRWHLELDAEATNRLSERVNDFFRLIDRALTKRAAQDPSLSGMGTTLTVAYAVGFDVLIFHIGDSRAYLWRDRRLQQVTRDETLAQAMADAGEITAAAVASHPMRHVLTRAMGTGTGTADAAVYPLRLEGGDRLLLCTDGLTDMISDAAVEDVLSRVRDPQQATEALIELALSAGGQDNVTAIVAQFASA